MKNSAPVQSYDPHECHGDNLKKTNPLVLENLYDRKNALVAADMLNDRVLPFFEEHQIPLLRILTDRGTEFCGAREHHAYELYLALRC